MEYKLNDSRVARLLILITAFLLGATSPVAQAEYDGKVIHRPQPLQSVARAMQVVQHVVKATGWRLNVGTQRMPMVPDYPVSVSLEFDELVFVLDTGEVLRLSVRDLFDIRVVHDTILTVDWYGVYVSPERSFWPAASEASAAMRAGRPMTRQGAIDLANALHTLHIGINPVTACIEKGLKNKQFGAIAGDIALNSVFDTLGLMLSNDARPTDAQKPVLEEWLKDRAACVSYGRRWMEKYAAPALAANDKGFSYLVSLTNELVEGKLTFGEFARKRLQAGFEIVVQSSNAALAAKNIAQAKSSYDFILARMPNFAPAYFYRAKVLAEGRDFDSALKDLQEYVKRDPSGEFAQEAKLKAAEWQEAALPDDVRFEQTARAYRSSPQKPELPEAARRLRIQADAAVKERDFKDAAKLYREALALAPWWPAGRFNLALVLAETGEFASAIIEMKRYLILEPQAPDARSAQDQIYVWERKVR